MVHDERPSSTTHFHPGVALASLTVPLDADTAISEIVSVKIYEPLEEPVPAPRRKRRPVAAPRVASHSSAHPQTPEG
jgi:hypothetical protein